MKNVQLSLLAVLIYTAGLHAKAFKKNVPTYEIGPGAKVNGNAITYNDPDCDEGLDCKTTRSCSKSGYTPSLSDDKKYFACCAAGQRLLGSADTAFDCCAKGHDLVGDSHCGYHCCPTGFSWDGKQCKEKCKNGQALVDGKCVCPKGTTESDDGTCKKTPDESEGECDDGECSSGLESGKCYIFKDDNGYRLGLGGDGNYYAAPDSMTQRYAKFQLCVDEQCTPGKPVNPSTEIFIRDTYGDLATGLNKNEWLAHSQNGIHINRTPLFSAAGHFSISKWPCGKYCLGGFTEGVGPACPAVTPALTFYTQDPQMCVEFEFTEVPCNIKSDKNNCIWKSGDQCCNKVDCSKPNCSKKGK
ncbi:cystein rich protein [Xylaria arbuscula]|nr:cystein rich protein [Xylaria arbuscula]